MVIIASNRKNVLKMENKIVMMVDDKVRDIGTYDQLMKNCELFKQVYND